MGARRTGLTMVLAGLAGLAGCTYTIRESNIVIPRAAPMADLAPLRARFPRHAIDAMRIASDDASLYAVRFVRPDARATVLYFGGNGFTVSAWAERIATAYEALPVNLVVLDHRGYGASSGTGGLQALYADARAAHDAVAGDPGLGRLPVIAHGHSLGSFIAGDLATQRTLGALVLESSVTTSEAWAAHLRARQAWWLRALVWRVRPDAALAGRGNAATVTRLDEPVLFVVGADDTTTPPRFSQALVDATALPPDRKTLLVVPGRGHQDAARSPEFSAAMSRLLDLVAAAPR